MSMIFQKKHLLIKMNLNIKLIKFCWTTYIWHRCVVVSFVASLQKKATQMNGTTAISTISLEDLLFAMYKNPIQVIRLYQIGYAITFLLGFLGNIASLLTFSRLTLRRISTSCLFMALAISDLSFLFTCIFDVIEFGFQVIEDLIFIWK